MKWHYVSLCHSPTAFLSILTHNSHRGYVDAWLSDETLRLKPWTFFSDYWSGTCIAGRQPHQAGIHQRRSMPGVHRSTVFLHGRPQIWRGLFDERFILFINENGFSSVSKLSFDFTDFVHWYITGERWNIIFIYTVTFSYNFSLLIRVSAPDAYLSVLRQSKHSLVKRYGDILLSLLFCEQII